MNAVVDCEALNTFYRVEEGGKTVSWRRNDRCRVEFFNTSISGRREEGQHLFWKEKGAHGVALGSHVEGQLKDAAAQYLLAAGVKRRLD
jgi:hypothetical protein